MISKKSIFYKIIAGIFHVITHETLRRRAAEMVADIAYRIHGLSGVTNLIHRLNSDVIPDILRKYGATVGEQLYVKTQLKIEASTYQRQNDLSNLTIGYNCFIGKGVFLDITDKLTIKDLVAISPGVKILTHASVANRPLKKKYPEKFASVVINKGAWIGAGATILSGVTIGECALVSAGAVVIKDVPPFTLVAGNPAKVKKTIDPGMLKK